MLQNYKREMECQQVIDDKRSFLSKRSILMKQNQFNRRDQIFNKTRRILVQAQCLQTEQEGQLPRNQGQASNLFNQSNNAVNLIEESNQADSKKIQLKMQQQGSKKNKKKSHHSRKKKQNQIPYKYYRNFQFPQWMIQIPQNLKQFYFCIRPAGQRVFLNIKKNKIQIISMYGTIINQIDITKGTFQKSFLQGYYIKQKSLIIISDMLIWKQNPMSSSQFPFRYVWLRNNFSDKIIQSIINHETSNNIQIKIIEYYQVDKQNLLDVYNNKVKHQGYETDGLMFYHKDSYYLHEANPNVLLWKDFFTAPSILNTKAKLISQIPTTMQIQKPYQTSNHKPLTHQPAQSLQQKMECLTLQQDRLYFYGQLNQANGLVSTCDRIPLFKMANIQLKQKGKKIIKFTFDTMIQRYDNQRTITILSEEKDWNKEKQLMEQNLPFVLSGFQIHHIYTIYDSYLRIPDLLTKIIFKYNFSENMKSNQDIIPNSKRIIKIQDIYNAYQAQQALPLDIQNIEQKELCSSQLSQNNQMSLQ